MELKRKVEELTYIQKEIKKKESEEEFEGKKIQGNINKNYFISTERKKIKKEFLIKDIEIRDCNEIIIELQNQITQLKNVISNLMENNNMKNFQPLTEMSNDDLKVKIIQKKNSKNFLEEVNQGCKNSCLNIL